MRCLLLAALVAATLAGPSPFVWADEFRMETSVFEGSNKKAQSKNLTLFRPGTVYDYLGEPASVAIFDVSRQRFVLLDTQNQLRAEVPLSEVTAFCQALRAQAINGPNEFLRFAANPTFETDFDAAAERLALSSSQLSYEVRSAKAPGVKASAQFREFSDAYCQLNAMLSPGGLPPFARLALNAELDKRQLVPKQVKLTIPRGVPLVGQGLSLRSEHLLTWRLVDDDQKRIATTDRQLSTFQTVSLAAFRSAAKRPPVARTAAAK